MLLVPGQIYQLQLRIEGAAAQRLHPSWLVGATRSVVPGLEVLSARGGATPRLRVRVKRPTQLAAGLSLTPQIEGVSAPGFALPSATVESVVEEPSALRRFEAGPTVGDIDRATPPWGKLLLSAALVGVVAIAITKMGPNT